MWDAPQPGSQSPGQPTSLCRSPTSVTALGVVDADPPVTMSNPPASTAASIPIPLALISPVLLRYLRRTRNGTTAELAVLPSRPRAIATTLMCSLRLNFAGSMNPRNGGDVSTSSRCHAPDARRTTNATLTGAAPPTVADAAQRFVRASAFTRSFGFGGPDAAIGFSASSTTAVVPATGTVRLPFAALDGGANGTGVP